MSTPGFIGRDRVVKLECFFFLATGVVVSHIPPERNLNKKGRAFCSVYDVSALLCNLATRPCNLDRRGSKLSRSAGDFGRSDTRARLRRFFEVDAESTVIATLYALAAKGLVEPQLVEKAIKDLGVDPDKIQPQIV